MALTPDTTEVPGPPPGPGAVPPFVAPPTEGRGGRLRLGLGLGGLALLLCCGGGGAALAGIVTVTSKALGEQVDVAVGDYLDAVRDRRFGEAYDQLCDRAQDAETLAEFTRRVSAQPTITSYDVGDLPLTSIEPAVPVKVVYAGGTVATLQVGLAQDRGTGRFEVCGVDG